MKKQKNQVNDLFVFHKSRKEYKQSKIKRPKEKRSEFNMTSN